MSLRPNLQAMSAEQLVGQVASYEATSARNAYALGLCLKELSQEKRFRDELGFDSFAALLAARKLPSRVTAFKLIQVVSAFSEEEVTKIGGTEKSYSLVSLAKRQGANTDPHRYLAANARVAGRAVSALSARDIDRVARGTTTASIAVEQSKAAKKISSDLGGELGRLGIKHRMRLHRHPDACVSVHLDPGSAKQLLDLLKRYRKLEGPAKRRQGALTSRQLGGPAKRR